MRRCDPGDVTGLDDVIDDITEQLDAEREAAFRERLREKLMDQPKEWLVDQLLERIGDAPSGESDETDTSDGWHVEAERVARAARIKALCLDDACLLAFIDRCRNLTRDRLERDGYLIAPPVKGAALIAAAC
jgi:hypothetical protein